MPYDHTEGAYPLGRWLSDQRRTFRAGQMSGERAEELEELGIVWDTADAGFSENLAAARAYYEQHGTLAAPRHATALDKPVGQWLTNVRRPGGLGKDPDRAERRAAALAAIDEDWNPGTLGWTVDWQRHYAYLAQLLNEGARPAAIVPGVTRHGEDIGRWLATQRRDFHRLNEEQQRCLAELGLKPARVVQARTTASKAGTVPAVRAGRGSLAEGRPGPHAVPGAGRRRPARAGARRTAPRRERAPYRGVDRQPEAAPRPARRRAARRARPPRHRVGTVGAVASTQAALHA